ncbi:hypothetical protein [Streptomyces sp. Ru72]|uniref:hypothetical protein n=1 Tax=Streptomyces sp. Ru72 TaxID=2080747 RepID=UPI000CDE1BF8|nr:hypothetical protein [Streptomyces sp. Ru72]POX44804.1 hypothetical protein C3488_31555 [Streptomyces sp. Ru72]
MACSKAATGVFSAALSQVFQAFGDGRLEVVPVAGRLPHIEQPDATFAHIAARMEERAPLVAYE